ncbi:MAG: CoA-binding protein [Rhodospirillaceae bacterium]|jgi:predicted CoA-binding protein|nr:CoA-binding protein [Rhodospirillaceae bacterium]MBT3885280.1 CoA-binding protein [Rhodospirillaceae bacterium]MBT4118938.1 CoA-binding protein [Rhodospirillaceae bacterium]MBT4673291.1 CoA-binding protein [Rhodospirillaceae bacterium]MBT4719176.1 CoA-binding protein [Rhodospirillaceae bacterium]
MSDLEYDDELIAGILERTETIAMVGASSNWVRPSHFAMKYLQSKGYRVIPVNPREAGSQLLGETVYADLAAIPDQFQMVDIFRNSKAAGGIADEAAAIKDKGIEFIWMQLGVRNDEAASRAEVAGLNVIMDRCPKIEYGRLYGELSWSGVNSRIISAKRPRIMQRRRNG